MTRTALATALMLLAVPAYAASPTPGPTAEPTTSNQPPPTSSGQRAVETPSNANTTPPVTTPPEQVAPK